MFYLREQECAMTPVSYTHLDVYKRQVRYGKQYDYRCPSCRCLLYTSRCV